MFKTVALLLLTATLAVAPIAFGDTKVQKDGFTLSLPDGWVEIPREAIDSYEKKMAELAPNAQIQHYDSGFQLDGSKHWLEYPYILIQVNHLGRIPESQLEQLQGYSVQKNVEDQKDKFSSIMSDIQAGEMVYDSKNKMIWMRLELELRGFGSVTGISGMVPTEDGFIQAIGYCPKDSYPTYESAFRSILTSITPDPGLAYKRKWSVGLPSGMGGIDWGQAATMAAAGAVIGGIVALIMRSRKKKKNA